MANHWDVCKSHLSSEQSGACEFDLSLEQPYVYRPPMRILELFPATDTRTPLTATLRTEDLRSRRSEDEDSHRAAPVDDEPYEALSYTWGDEDFTSKIYIDGRALPITTNLQAALLQLRLRETKRRLWVDAICINQADDTERTTQVAVMSQIYKFASRTLSWVGAESDRMDAESLFTFLTWLSNKDHYAQWMQVMRDRPLYLDWALDTYNSSNNEAVANLGSLKLFCSRSYFTRRWIVQEIGVASNTRFQCGGSVIEGDVLAKAAERLVDATARFPITSPFIRLMHLIRPSIGDYIIRSSVCRPMGDLPGEDMLRAMEHFRELECKDDRDRIAALRLVSTAPCIENLVIDYKAPAESLYTAFAVDLSSYSLVCLVCILTSAARRALLGSTKLPMWVPDWTLPPRVARAELTPVSGNIANDPQLTEVVILHAPYGARDILRSQFVAPSTLRLTLVYWKQSYALMLGCDPPILRPGDCVLHLATIAASMIPHGPISGYGHLGALVIRQHPIKAQAWCIVGALEIKVGSLQGTQYRKYVFDLH